MRPVNHSRYGTIPCCITARAIAYTVLAASGLRQRGQVNDRVRTAVRILTLSIRHRSQPDRQAFFRSVGSSAAHAARIPNPPPAAGHPAVLQTACARRCAPYALRSSVPANLAT